ncbi:MAG: DUF3100 domain-containing protein [Thermoanaerobacteraceae bacterium]|nr:DUF3100 domain-containing protein [Thermoanaerobacteraceae bacterium]
MKRDIKLHVIALVLVVIAELIGAKSFKVGPGTVVLLPMLFALIMGMLLGPKVLKIVDMDDMKRAAPWINISVMLLIAKYGTNIGPTMPLLLKSSPALILQEFGNLGTIFLSLPIAMLLGLKRETIGACFSIAREGSLAIVSDVYGLDTPEGRGVMGVYISGTLFGTIFFGIMAGLLSPVFHPFALAMACGVGSASMMAASSGSLVAIFPQYASEIQAFASASNLLTGADGVYMSIFMALPITEWLYKKFSRGKAAVKAEVGADE